MSRKICVLTASRSEYGLLRPLILAIRDDSRLSLQLIVTGAHLAPGQGQTETEIERDGLRPDRRVEMLLDSDSGPGMAKSMGLALIGLADALEQLRPDVLVLLGDRYETLAAASAALACRVPVAHLHGGELTEGAIDDAIRHAVTKLSHLHFVAASEYAARVVSLGEHPDRVFQVGALGLDNIAKLEPLGRAALERDLDFRFGERNLLVTFHPETLANEAPEAQLEPLLMALDAFPDVHLLFTLPNADAGGHAIRRRIERFVAGRPNARARSSLGQLRYLSFLREADGMAGNSSSGLIEAPSMRKGTVNIGGRQAGRLRASSVLDCSNEVAAIRSAIKRLYSADFQTGLVSVCNPYGDGGAAGRIAEVLATRDLEGLARKKFYPSPVMVATTT
jgi:GDP/UDP-N,N'-diacetylbacillosamine 2-epimerase (hydrolysing)